MQCLFASSKFNDALYTEEINTSKAKVIDQYLLFEYVKRKGDYSCLDLISLKREIDNKTQMFKDYEQ